jgi:hypothetical protein
MSAQYHAQSQQHGFVAAEWTRKWARLTRMSWAEAHERARQEFSKRLDFGLYSVGLGPRMPLLHPQSAPTPNFFLGNGEHELAHRAALLRGHLPQEAEGIIHEADNICRHEFHLLGYEGLNYGPNLALRSSSCKAQLAEAPFKINFLDIREIGDHKSSGN